MKANFKAKEMLELQKKGLSLREIGLKYGRCKQRIWQILKKYKESVAK